MPYDAFMGKIVHNNAIWVHIGEINVRLRLGLNLRKAYRAKYGSLLYITAAWHPRSNVGKASHGMIQAAETSSMQECMPGPILALSEKSPKRSLGDLVRKTIEEMLNGHSRRKPTARSARSDASAPPVARPTGRITTTAGSQRPAYGF
jgi:hypothetical protein